MDTNLFVDKIDKSQGTEGPDGYTHFDPSFVQESLMALCREHDFDYRWQFANTGFTPDGRAFYIGTLCVFGVSGEITVTGAATAATHSVGVAGVMTTAFVNACLRGLGMGRSLYEDTYNNPIQEPEEQQAPQQQQYQQPQASQYPNASRSNGGYPTNVSGGNQRPPQRNFGGGGGNGAGYGGNGNGGGYGGNGGGGGGRSTWDGSYSPKSGQWMGTPYRDIPIEVLQTWANMQQPNKSAVSELNRRMSPQQG